MRVPRLGVLLCICGWVPAALADDYVAVSGTAMAVTGDIAMDDFALTFANGKSLAFSALVADRFEVEGKSVPASVFRVARPADPVLENGNRLCGVGKVTYVANWAADNDMSVVAVFTGAAPPRSDASMCASYTYGLAAGDDAPAQDVVSPSGPGLPFVGIWVCDGATYRFTATEFHDGADAYAIEEAQEGTDGSYTLFFADGDVYTLSGFRAGTMRWHSHNDQQTYFCTRKD